MADRLQRIEQISSWPGGVALPLALAVAVTPALVPLEAGGLAPLAVAALFAGLLAVPLARAEWQGGLGGAPFGRAIAAVCELIGVLVVAAVAAPLVRAGGWAGALAMLVAWGLLALLVPRGRGAVAVVLGAVALGVATVGAGGALAHAPPWTLLEPRWEAWQDWLGPALVGSLLLPAAGLGHWLDAPERVGPARRLPWAVAGSALLVVLLVSAWRGAAWEGAAAGQVPDPVLLIWPLSLVVALGGAASVLARPGGGLGRAGAGVVATLWLAGPAWAALPVFWHTLLPLGIGLLAAAVAWRSPAHRVVGLGAALVALVAVVLGWPGLPGAGAAAAIALLPVWAVWYAGGRVLLEARA